MEEEGEGRERRMEGVSGLGAGWRSLGGGHLVSTVRKVRKGKEGKEVKQLSKGAHSVAVMLDSLPFACAACSLKRWRGREEMERERREGEVEKRGRGREERER